ncbi:MAG TPA: RNA-guided endonuclease TnpB family protein [Thermoplasmata archaeon]|nr:RNA-guided endonuclease TnpB family protein [Thermoplasmata archaeon]
MPLQTLMVRMEPAPEQRDALLRTVEAMNRGSDYAAKVAFRERCANKNVLQKLVYRDLREKFALSAQMAIRIIAKSVEAYKRDKAVQPKFRPRGAVPYDQRILSWKGPDTVSLLTLSGRIRVPVIWGEYQKRVLEDRPVRGQADLIWRDGKFYLAVIVEAPDVSPYEPQGALGVDLGVVNIATDSDGTTYSSEPVDKVRGKADRLKGRLQRAGTRSARRHLQRAARRESNFRRQTNHCISKSIVARAEDTKRAVALEDLGGIRERTTVRRSQRRRHLSWSFAQLRVFVEYKAAAKGVPVVLVDPRNTSRTCPRCGTIDRKNRRTREEFRCVSCGLAGPADRIAATNIAARAGVDRPIVAGSEEVWGHVSDLSCKPPILIGGR